MGCIDKIFIGLCLVVTAMASGGNHMCYVCSRESSDVNCNSGGAKRCTGSSPFACHIYYHRHAGRVEISKKCIPQADCIRPDLYLCNYDFSECSYCCTSDLCNYKTPGKPATEAPAKGDRGPFGWPGPKGPQGRTGHPGPKGPPGPPGPDGTLGMVGDKGYKGAVGIRGAPGAPGPAGGFGNSGLLGPPGPNGPVGEKGDDGWPGDQGYKGHPGDRGLRGVPGAEGPKGGTGLKGYKGHSGVGPKGPKGQKGDGGGKGNENPPLTGDDGEIGWPGDGGQEGEDGEPGANQVCDCETQDIFGFTIFTGLNNRVDVPLVPNTFIAYTVTITLVNTFNLPMLSTNVMQVTVTVRGVYIFQVVAVSVCDLAHDIAIVLIRGGTRVILVNTGRDVNDAFHSFPVGTAHVSYCLDVGDVIGVIATAQEDPHPGYTYPTPSPTDVWFTGCLLRELPDNTPCPPNVPP